MTDTQNPKVRFVPIGLNHNPIYDQTRVILDAEPIDTIGRVLLPAGCTGKTMWSLKPLIIPIIKHRYPHEYPYHEASLRIARIKKEEGRAQSTAIE